MDPNIIGRAGNNYRGLIQFGPGARQEVGLPDGPMTITEQMPYVRSILPSADSLRVSMMQLLFTGQSSSATLISQVLTALVRTLIQLPNE